VESRCHGRHLFHRREGEGERQIEGEREREREGTMDFDGISSRDSTGI